MTPSDAELIKLCDQVIAEWSGNDHKTGARLPDNEEMIVARALKTRLSESAPPPGVEGRGDEPATPRGDEGELRYEIATASDEEPGLILILDNEKHIIVARSSEIALPLVEELVSRANATSLATTDGFVKYEDAKAAIRAVILSMIPELNDKKRPTAEEWIAALDKVLAVANYRKR